MNISDLKICVVDNGRFFHVARRLARDAKQVYYWTPNERDCPTLRDASIGYGYPEVKKVLDFWKTKDANLFVFPDIGFAGLQKELIRQGYLVWGSRDADSLEINRGLFLKTMAKIGMPVPNYHVSRGVENLRDFLRMVEDKYVKLSRFRGDQETFHWTNYDEMSGDLDLLSVRLGPFGEDIYFYVIDPIPTDIEDGVDGYCIDGQWPEHVLKGMEAKDKAYLGTIQKLAEVPDEVRIANERIGPVLAKYGYRGFFSTEVRVTKDAESYFIDPTCRAGSPPSQVQCELFGNYTEIIFKGAQGELIDPEPVKQFGVQAALNLAEPRTNWTSVKFDKNLDRWLKLCFAAKMDDLTVFAPMPDYTTTSIGYLCAIGDTIGQAINRLREMKERLPEGISCEFGSLADLLKEIESAEEKGMEFTEQKIPPPEIILQEKE